MTAIAITLFILASLRAYQACHDHGKLKGWGKPAGFFGSKQWTRKYKSNPRGAEIGVVMADQQGNLVPNFPGSTTWLVFLTDGYHLFQFIERPVMLIVLPLLVCHQPLHWWLFASMWGLYVFVFAVVYKLLQK